MQDITNLENNNSQKEEESNDSQSTLLREAVFRNRFFRSQPKHPAIDIKPPKINLDQCSNIGTYRIYITEIRDGYGDIQHLIDYATAVDQLPSEFKGKFPAFFVIIPPESPATNIYIQKKLLSLPTSHPLYFKNIGKTFVTHKSSQPFVTNFHLEDKINNAIVYNISTLPMCTYPRKTDFIDNRNRTNPVHINIGEHGAVTYYSNHQQMVGPFNRHLGFTNSNKTAGFKNINRIGHGIFINDNKPISQTELDNCDNKAILQTILQTDEPVTVEALQNFKRQNLLVPLYVQDKIQFEIIANTILYSDIIKDKNLIFIVTNEQYKNYYDFLSNMSCRVVTYNFDEVNDLTKRIIDSLCQYIYPCSGDKSLEKAFELNCLPLYQIRSGDLKEIHYRGLIEIIKNQFEHHQDNEEFQQLIKYLESRLPEKILVELTSAAVKFWHDFCLPYLKNEYNFNKYIPAIELQSIIMHEIIAKADYSHINQLAEVLTVEELYNFLFICQDSYGLKLDEMLSKLDSKTFNKLIEFIEKQKDQDVPWKVILSILVNIQDLNLVENLLNKFILKDHDWLDISIYRERIYNYFKAYPDHLRITFTEVWGKVFPGVDFNSSTQNRNNIFDEDDPTTSDEEDPELIPYPYFGK